ncbi:mannosyltransferase [Parafrankia soli]|uniref:Mannosyltransferase n=1 Tax=Parafrankia soli TaxID=2599596 RepID=A0A1S1PHR1_9ACTN|nr:glycosyltransferase [Parafrankia soli]OHV20142.1 mannosyltransferase [Parafrankia soli]
MTPAIGRVLVDCAGARMGGALRFLTELDSYLADRPSADVEVVGRDRRVAPTWLARRETLGRHRRSVALNNVGFVATRGERWVLLRNLLHFLPPEEIAAIPGGLPPGTAQQAQIIRACARRADMVVVPTTTMAQRVLAVLPELTSRLAVRPHPLSRAPAAAVRGQTGDRVDLLCPVLFAPFKAMGRLLRPVDRAAGLAARQTGAEITVSVTATASEAHAEGLAGCRHLRFVGRLTPTRLAEFQQSCHAIVYPTRIESFGYPLAEARLAGVWAIAADCPHNREVAGPVLIAYQRDTPDDLAAAMVTALGAIPEQRAENPFDPVRYFDWLLDARTAAT